MKLNFSGNIGFFLLAIYLILQGLSLLIEQFAIPTIVFGTLALVTGIFILIGK